MKKIQVGVAFVVLAVSSVAFGGVAKVAGNHVAKPAAKAGKNAVKAGARASVASAKFVKKVLW